VLRSQILDVDSEVRFHSSTNSIVTHLTVPGSLCSFHFSCLGVIRNLKQSWGNCKFTRVSIHCCSVDCSFLKFCLLLHRDVLLYVVYIGVAVYICQHVALAQISFAAAASLVRPCVMIYSGWTYYEFISFMEHFLYIFNWIYVSSGITWTTTLRTWQLNSEETSCQFSRQDLVAANVVNMLWTFYPHEGLFSK
jgi:hypothetical protein